MSWAGIPSLAVSLQTEPGVLSGSKLLLPYHQTHLLVQMAQLSQVGKSKTFLFILK